MSYILEALKKAQAERQIGNAPTIHAPAPMYAASGAERGGQRRTLMLGLGLGALALAVGAVLLWPRPEAVPAPAQVAVAPVIVPAPPVLVIPAPAPTPAPTPTPAPVVAKPAPAPAKKPEPAPTPRRVVEQPAAPAVQPGADDTLRSLQQLPEALRREIPQVAFGGYIYSPTPGESLLLVDKTLRREGEEVAPGLVLERLTPKAAVMNYRGTRYRVGY